MATDPNHTELTLKRRLHDTSGSNATLVIAVPQPVALQLLLELAKAHRVAHPANELRASQQAIREVSMATAGWHRRP